MQDAADRAASDPFLADQRAAFDAQQAEERAAKRKRDRTPWPSQDASGNNLRHDEDCAWRFGGRCDCSRQA